MRKIRIAILSLLILTVSAIALLGVRLMGFEGGHAVLSGDRLYAVADVGYRFVGWESGEREESISIFSGKGIFSVPLFEEKPSSFPSIIINTEGGEAVTTKERYINCTVTLTNTDEEYELTDLSGRIKLRGNSTAGYPKKPFKLKLDEKTSFFGEGAAKEWTLLANHMDYSLVRNYLVFSAADELDQLMYTSSVHFVDVYVNGSFEGVYTLCEQVEVGKNRVNIADELDTVNTGYLIEMDARAPAEGVLDRDYFTSQKGQHYAIKSPDTEEEEFTQEHLAFIRDYVNSAISAIDSGDWSELTGYIDVYSFVDGYIIDELFKPCDIGFSSFYMYKDTDGKLCRGPIWDYDLSSGNCFTPLSNDTANMYTAGVNPWYQGLLTYPEFRELLSSRLSEKKDNISDRIDECFESISDSALAFERNFERWDILGDTSMEWNSDEVCAIATWEEQIEYLSSWLDESLDSMLEKYE